MSRQNTRGRTIQQRIAVRSPGLVHLTGEGFRRLPRGSRLRRAFVERTVRAGYEAWNRDDMEVARAYADPEVEVYVAQGSDLPVGLDEAYYGPDGYSRDMFFLANRDSVSAAVQSLAEHEAANLSA